MSYTPKTEVEIKQRVDDWIQNQKNMLRASMYWAARAEDALNTAQALAETSPTPGSTNGNIVMRQTMLADSMANISRALSEITQSTRLAVIAEQLYMQDRA